MKNIILITLLFVSCKITNNKLIQNNNNTEKQVFISNQKDGLPGKCYQKMMLNGQTMWTEVLCGHEITKNLVKQLQSGLVSLGFQINNEELTKSKMGESTKSALKQFQQKNKLAFGGLDWATINRIKNQ